MKRKGFTNLEVLMAVAIFGLIIVFIMKLNSRALRAVNSGGNILAKTYFAQMKAEEYKSNLSVFENKSNSEIKNNNTYYYFADTSNSNFDILVEWCWFDNNELLRDVFITVKDKNSNIQSAPTLECFILKSSS